MKLLFALVTSLTLPVGAFAQTYSCTTHNFGTDGWVPPKLILSYDLKTGKGTAYDGYIDILHDGPISVEVERRSATSVIFRWRLDGLKASNGGSGINSYKATLFTKTNKFTLSGRRHGFDNSIHGSGKCQKVK